MFKINLFCTQNRNPYFRRLIVFGFARDFESMCEISKEMSWYICIVSGCGNFFVLFSKTNLRNVRDKNIDWNKVSIVCI